MSEFNVESSASGYLMIYASNMVIECRHQSDMVYLEFKTCHPE